MKRTKTGPPGGRLVSAHRPRLHTGARPGLPSGSGQASGQRQLQRWPHGADRSVKDKVQCRSGSAAGAGTCLRAENLELRTDTAPVHSNKRQALCAEGVQNHARGRHPMDTGGKTLGLSALRAWEKPAPARRERKGRGCQQHASASRSREPEGVTEPTTLPPAPRIGSAGNSLYCRKNMMKSIKQSGMKETVITLDREREGG